MGDSRIISWFSCGAASAVATKLTITKYGHDRVVVAYCATGSEHPDNERFMQYCARWFGQPVHTLRNDQYTDTWHLWNKRRYLSGIHGATCTTELKVEPRLDFQKPGDTHIFGYTADRADFARAAAMTENYPELLLEYPLIERGITKAAALAMIDRAGIALPPMYALGFQNNNCIPCVKATSPAYWALIRLHFPQQFNRMASLSRELSVRLCRLNGERIFIDEIPADHPTTDPTQPSCDFLCALAEQELTP